MFVDFILNGQGHGAVAEQLAASRYDPGLMRPYVDQRGQKCCTVNTGRTRYDKEKGDYFPVFEKVRVTDLIANGIQSPIFNATVLRKDDWVLIDRVVLMAARKRLRAWGDLAAASTFGGFNGMAKTVLEHETMNDPGEAIVDMDGLSDSRSDSPRYQLEGLPLPITHSGFQFSERRLATSRNSGTPLDTTMIEAAGRRVAEMIEKTLIGVTTGITYGPSAEYSRAPSVYGYTNFPDRILKNDLTTPTGSNAASTLADVLEMRDLLYDAGFYGPFMLYHSSDWDAYMDNDYTLTGGNVTTQTLRDRLRAIDDIQDVKRLDFFTDTFTLLMVQMTSDVARAVNGMDITTIQWPTVGGLQQNFKVMAIHVPQLRSDFNGNCGIVHATTS